MPIAVTYRQKDVDIRGTSATLDEEKYIIYEPFRTVFKM